MYSTRPTFLQRFELVCLPFFKGTPGTDSMKKLGNQRTWRFLGLKSQILTVDRYWRLPFIDIENGLPGKWWFSLATLLMKFAWGNKHWCGQSTKENHGFSASFSIFTLGYINIFQHLPIYSNIYIRSPTIPSDFETQFPDLHRGPPAGDCAAAAECVSGLKRSADLGILGGQPSQGATDWKWLELVYV